MILGLRVVAAHSSPPATSSHGEGWRPHAVRIGARIRRAAGLFAPGPGQRAQEVVKCPTSTRSCVDIRASSSTAVSDWLTAWVVPSAAAETPAMFAAI
jgi:hypothetical protein